MGCAPPAPRLPRLVGTRGARRGSGGTVTAGAAGVGPCHRGLTDAAGRDAFRVTAPSYGVVSVRLRSAGDWDVAVFGAKRRLVAASAGFAGNELAEGFVRKGERLIVQACRYRGDAATADVSVRFTAIAKKKAAGKVQVVDVITRQRADKQRLQALGLDLTEHGDAELGRGRAARHAATRARCVRAGFRYRVRIADLAARTRRNAGPGPALRARVRGLRAAERPRRLPASGRLRPRDEAARGAVPVARQTAHAQVQERAGP